MQLIYLNKEDTRKISCAKTRIENKKQDQTKTEEFDKAKKKLV